MVQKGQDTWRIWIPINFFSFLLHFVKVQMIVKSPEDSKKTYLSAFRPEPWSTSWRLCLPCAFLWISSRLESQKWDIWLRSVSVFWLESVPELTWYFPSLRPTSIETNDNLSGPPSGPGNITRVEKVNQHWIKYRWWLVQHLVICSTVVVLTKSRLEHRN